MNKLVEIFKQRDKQLHFAAGAGIALVAGLLLSPLVGFALAAATGLLKEIYDSLQDEVADTVDFWVTTFGGFVVSLILGVVNYV